MIKYSLFDIFVFFFVIYANNFWNCMCVCLYTVLMPMKF